jgi:trehalose/maltose hydrolase-like predicted phosphorylase
LQYNLISGHWKKDHTFLQRHIGAIIAYNVCQYLQVTGDRVFLSEYGAEIVLEIARFWASIAEYSPEQDRYEIKGVAGPDEYHTLYPGASTPGASTSGINNNTYTNVMAAWTLCRAKQVWEELDPQRRQDLWEMLSLSNEEFQHW